MRGRQEVRDSAEVMAACKTAMETAFWCVRSLAPSQRRRSRAVEAFIGVTRADMSSTVKRVVGRRGGYIMVREDQAAHEAA